MKKVRYITDAAMITAVVIAILLLSEFTGLELEESFFFLLPAPMALYALLHGPKKTFIPAISISLLAMIIHSPIHGLIFVAPSCFVGVLYGFFLDKKYPEIVRISIAIVGALIVNVLTSFIFSELLFGITIIEDTRAIVLQLIGFLSFANFSDQFKSLLEALMIGLIPALIAVTSILEGLLAHVVTIFLANRIAKTNELGIFRGLRVFLPRCMTYGLLPIMVVSIVFLPNYVAISGVGKVFLVIGINLSFAAMAFYAFEGLATAGLYFHRQGKPGLYVIAVIVLIVFFPAISLIGIADSLFKLQDKLLKRT
jgi:hypothetical protein